MGKPGGENMKWYLLSHLLNLYILPIIGYTILAYIFTDFDIFAYEEALFFGYIPLGSFLISFIYGLRKRKPTLFYCFACSFLCIPLAFLDSVTGNGIANNIAGVVFLYYTYFAIALMGNITGMVVYLGYISIKKFWKRTKRF